jgi:hypothetical protein
MSYYFEETKDFSTQKPQFKVKSPSGDFVGMAVYEGDAKAFVEELNLLASERSFLNKINYWIDSVLKAK